MDMHYLLRAKGIENNKFFLSIYDPDLMGIDPRDPTLSKEIRIRVFRECLVNFWYFIREVVRIPSEGGDVGGGERYKLHRGNLAMNYLFINNYDQFVDLPRQHFKTVSALIWYLWVFNFGSSNTKMMFINMKHEKSKENLATMKNIRDSLPDYLKMDAAYDRFGKKIRVTNAAETLQHPTNKNIIKTLPAARTKQLADGAGRGCTMAIQYYDEFAFIPYNSIIYAAAQPAYSRAKQNAQLHRAPYGMLITTTPGDLTTDEGAFANSFRLNATPWNDAYYDRTRVELDDIHNSNTDSTFFYIRYTYKQLGSTEAYFKEMVTGLQKDYAKIRREVLLEWASGAMNCPFKQEDLDVIKSLCRNEPLSTMFFGRSGQYQLNIWNKLPLASQYPPIIGVDVAGGWQNDSSAITIIDSQTTTVLATLNCNFIPCQDLYAIIVELVTQHMKNAIVNVERNGGFGGTLLQMLIRSKIKKNLYYEIKEQVKDERWEGAKVIRNKKKVHSYGTDNTQEVRNNLIELLHQRVNFHKDKFAAPILYDELTTMEVKKNGKTEHASSAHDDQIFSYLMALYVWYYGENITQRFNIFKTELKTDQNMDETEFDLDDSYGETDISNSFTTEEYIDTIVEEQQTVLKQFNTKSQEEFYEMQANENRTAMEKLLRNKDARKAYAETYNLDQQYLEEQFGGAIGSFTDIGNDVLDDFYSDKSGQNQTDHYAGNLADLFRKI